MKKLLAFLACLALLLVTACTGQPTPPGPAPAPEEIDSVSYETGERDYVYAFPEGEYDSDAQKLNFQAPNYMLQLNGEEGTLSGFENMDYEEEYLVGRDFSELAASGTAFGLESNGTRSRVTGVKKIANAGGSGGNATNDATRYWRLIESGRYLQRVDILQMLYDREADVYGRLEVAASKEQFALTYQAYSPALRSGAVLTLEFSSAKYRTYEELLGGRAAALKAADGSGLAFVLPEGVTASGKEGSITLSSTVNLRGGEYCGFSVLAVPFLAGGESAVGDAVAREQVEISALQTSPVDNVVKQNRYDGSRGIAMVDGNVQSDFNYYDYSIPSNRDAYDNFRLTLTNPTDRELTYLVAVKKNTTALAEGEREFGTAANFGMSGMTPVLRDTSGEPTGIPVQTCKNWHSYGVEDEKTVERYLEGQWFNGYTEITVPANGTRTYDFTITYANWGGVAAASHSQLTLVGWGGYTLWEQLALASWGESICYSPWGNRTGAWIQDIRPFMVTNDHGGNRQYNWPGNTGGGEFLRYSDKTGALETAELMTDFVSQGPNLTDVRYFGVTSDGKILVKIRSMLGRTDDVTRMIYELDYTFLEDTPFSSLSFFSLCTERYQQNYFGKYAYGNAEEILKDEEMPRTNYPYYESQYAPQREEVSGEDPWFLLYDYRNEAGRHSETSNNMFTVREYDATFNGKRYSSPSFNRRQVGIGSSNQLTFELTAPADAGNTIQRGSRVRMTVEQVVLPMSASTYYGASDYLNATKELFNTAQSGLQQAAGNALEVSVTAGALVSRYPLTVASASGDTAAAFTLKGGLGYTPVVVTGLSSPTGWKLQKKVNGVFADVSQSVNGNDFWQCGYDAASKTYRLVYNVKNSTGTDFSVKNEYRLVRA